MKKRTIINIITLVTYTSTIIWAITSYGWELPVIILLFLFANNLENLKKDENNN